MFSKEKTLKYLLARKKKYQKNISHKMNIFKNIFMSIR